MVTGEGQGHFTCAALINLPLYFSTVKPATTRPHLQNITPKSKLG